MSNLITVVSSGDSRADHASTETGHNSRLTMAYFNAQSVRQIAGEIHDFIADNTLDALILTETWLQEVGDEPCVKEMTPPDYVFHSFPRVGRRGGGIAVLMSKSLAPKVTFRCLSYASFEAVTMCLSAEKLVNLTVVYRPPPSKQNKLTTKMFLQDFELFLDERLTERDKTVVIGDFNLHFDVQTNPDVQKLCSLLSDQSFTQIVDEPTHKRGHILDWLVTAEDSTLIHDVSVSENLLSDHKSLFFSLSLSRPLRKKRSVTSRNIRRINLEKFQSEVKAMCSTVLGDCPEEELAEKYNDSMQQLLDRHAPLKTRCVTERRSAPWINDNIRAAKRELRRAERTAHRTRFTVHREIFVKQRNALKALHRAAKRDYLCDKIRHCSSIRLLYSVTDELMGRMTELKLPTNIPLWDLPNTFSDFMHEKIANIRRVLDSCPVPASFEPFADTGLCTFAPVSEDLIRKLITDAPPKCCALDPIPTALLKTCYENLVPVITKIVNYSLLSGSVPQCFKQALVRPLLKKPSLDQNMLKNYRPVSNLSFLSKLLERVVLLQLTDHVSRNDLLERNQSAYRQNYSTETALLHITNCLLESTDQGRVSILSLLDLSAAFDTIDHNILLERLHMTFGISGSALQWLRSYILDRFQVVVVNSISSTPQRLDFGVPQGSVLGPLLFVLYTQPVSRIVRQSGSDLHKFSDDTQLFSSALPVDFGTLIKQTETCVEHVKAWIDSNKLKLNDDKTEALVVGTRSRTGVCYSEHLNIGGSPIPFQPKVKSLGVVLDSSLTMSHHISSVCRSAYLELRRISAIRPFLTTSATATLVCSRVLSRIDYCNSLLAGITSDQIARLQRILNNSARLIFRKKRSEHVTPMLISLHWLPIKQRIEYKLATLAFRYFDGTLPPYLSHCLSSYTPHRSLRSSSDKLLCVPRVNLKSAGARSFQYQAPCVWNSVPIQTRLSPSLTSFKSSLKTHLFRNAFT